MGPLAPVDVHPGRWPGGHRQGDGSRDGGAIGGPIIDAAGHRVGQGRPVLEPGAEFQFTFDLGDDWTHRCVVGEDKIDPLEVLGITP